MRSLFGILALATCLTAPGQAQKVDSRAVGLWGSEDSVSADGLLLSPDGTFRQVILVPGKTPSYTTGTWWVDGSKMCMHFKTPLPASFCWSYTVTSEHRLFQGDAAYFPLNKNDRRVRLLERGGT